MRSKRLLVAVGVALVIALVVAGVLGVPVVRELGWEQHLWEEVEAGQDPSAGGAYVAWDENHDDEESLDVTHAIVRAIAPVSAHRAAASRRVEAEETTDVGRAIETGRLADLRRSLETRRGTVDEPGLQVAVAAAWQRVIEAYRADATVHGIAPEVVDAMTRLHWSAARSNQDVGAEITLVDARAPGAGADADDAQLDGAIADALARALATPLVPSDTRGEHEPDLDRIPTDRASLGGALRARAEIVDTGSPIVISVEMMDPMSLRGLAARVTIEIDVPADDHGPAVALVLEPVTVLPGPIHFEAFLSSADPRSPVRQSYDEIVTNLVREILWHVSRAVGWRRPDSDE